MVLAPRMTYFFIISAPLCHSRVGGNRASKPDTPHHPFSSLHHPCHCEAQPWQSSNFIFFTLSFPRRWEYPPKNPYPTTKNLETNKKSDTMAHRTIAKTWRGPHPRGKSGLLGTTHRLIYRAGRPDDKSNSDETIKFE